MIHKEQEMLAGNVLPDKASLLFLDRALADCTWSGKDGWSRNVRERRVLSFKRMGQTSVHASTGFSM